MKVIILVAGIGMRLKPITNNMPKSLIKVDKDTVLFHIMDNCLYYNIKDLIVVVGYKKELIINELNKLKIIQGINFYTVENQNYSITNTGCSLYLALKDVNGEDVIIINGDNIFDRRILEGLLNTNYSSIVVDNVKKLTPESFKVCITDNKILLMGKNISIEKSNGEFIGISLLRKKDIEKFRKILRNIISMNNKQYYDFAFKEFSKKEKLEIIFTNGLKWTEIDTHEQLLSAKKLIKEMR